MSTGTALCNQSTVVAGAYWGSIQFPNETEWPLGATDDGGFEIEEDYSFEDILTDQAGDTVVGALNRGGNCYVNATFKEFNAAGVQRLLRPISDFEGQLGSIGCDIRNMSAQLSLVPVEPFVNQPSLYLFEHVQIDPNVPLRKALSSRLRMLPFRFRVFPVLESGVPVRWYSVTPTNPAP